MRHLTLSFVGEGESDYDFFPPLLLRLVERELARAATQRIEVGAVYPYYPANRCSNTPAEVIRAVNEADLVADVLFYHTDAAGDVDGAYAYRVQIVEDGIRERVGCPAVVGVVPQREMEAWILADLDALRRTMGVRTLPGVDDVPEPPRIHTLAKPKEKLDDLVTTGLSRSGRRGRRRVARSYLAACAANISLNVLSEVPQVRRCLQDLVSVLSAKGVVE